MFFLFNCPKIPKILASIVCYSPGKFLQSKNRGLYNLVTQKGSGNIFDMSIKKAKKLLAEREHNEEFLELWLKEVEELKKRQASAHKEIESLCSDFNTLTVEDYDKASDEFNAVLDQLQRVNWLFKKTSTEIMEIRGWIEKFSKEVSSLEKLLAQHRETFRNL